MTSGYVLSRYVTINGAMDLPAIPRLCAICGKRKPKRFCPGVHGDICPLCCGTEREVTVHCPLDCVYLQESRKHEVPPQVDARDVPNVDIKVDEAFLHRNEPLLILLASAMARAALIPGSGIVDSDVKAALDSLIRTWRTLQSGLVYDARPDNPIAGRLYTAVRESIEEIRRKLSEHGQTLRDSDILGVVVFLQRLELQHNNGRLKSRAFIDFLRAFFPAAKPSDNIVSGDQPGSGLILTP
ncbi:MAG: hypothetical protein H7039_08715 [Bryobacteraceae bacterium]|nr:hypothetical protein [Bryobacteraceae bacterium]